MPQNSDTAKINASYFLKLASVLAILGIIWLSSNFFNAQKNIQEKTSDIPAMPVPFVSQPIFAATLPIAEDAYLVPNADALVPVRKWSIDAPKLTAESIYIFETNSGKVLLEKNPDQVRSIASLTKLITAMVILDKANIKDEVLISKNAVDTYGEMGNLKTGETMTIEGLLYAMLIESSNDAAVALSEKFDGQFVKYMNEKAAVLGLQKTKFLDPSGLDSENVSTAKELAKIMHAAIGYPLINVITTTPEADILSSDGTHNHHLVNSDKLLSKYPEIIAGKTGFIDEAGNCMIVAIKSPNGKGEIINVILGSQDRIGEMDKLIKWEREAFIW